jgi:L-alanine-DL-glutamate epimerase-like enolase superfamily enzyme
VSMKVVSVQARCLHIPLKFPFTETPRTEGLLVVHVETDEGLEGAGISRDAERVAVRALIHRDISPLLLGTDPLATEHIWSDACWDIGMSAKVRTGVVARAIGAVDHALWDITGPSLNQPIDRLLGGASPASVGAYTPFGFAVMLRVDGHRTCDWHHARALARRRDPSPLTWCDDPVSVPDVQLMAERRRCPSIPLALWRHGRVGRARGRTGT